MSDERNQKKKQYFCFKLIGTILSVKLLKDPIMLKTSQEYSRSFSVQDFIMSQETQDIVLTTLFLHDS